MWVSRADWTSLITSVNRIQRDVAFIKGQLGGNISPADQAKLNAIVDGEQGIVDQIDAALKKK